MTSLHFRSKVDAPGNALEFNELYDGGDLGSTWSLKIPYLPLKKNEWNSYLKWAIDSFKIASSSVKDETQIHTHMCYCEFDDILDSIEKLDADVISIETSRSNMELLDSFKNYKYPNSIGPGVYDIHSPRVPTFSEIKILLKKAQKYLNKEKIWVNPDCGLKTRGWPEVKKALKSMTLVAKSLR